LYDASGVKKWTTVDKTVTPDGKTIALDEHDGSYTIRVNGAPLMSTREHGSEEKLAEFGCAGLKEKPSARVLIGGLGFGFTLKAALAAVAADASVVVAEILASVIAWNRNPLLPLASGALADSRVTVIQQDVREVMRRERGGFDSILLDVDNGPAAVTADDNAELYTAAGLKLARAALRPDGCVAFWSAEPDRPFEGLMARAGFEVEVRRSRARPGGGTRHYIFLGRVLE
jgi:spermidine synthase